MDKLNLNNTIKGIAITVRCPVCGRWSHVKTIETYGFQTTEPEVYIQYVTSGGRGKLQTRHFIESENIYSKKLYATVRSWFKNNLTKLFQNKEDKTWQEKLTGIRSELIVMPSSVVESKGYTITPGLLAIQPKANLKISARLL